MNYFLIWQSLDTGRQHGVTVGFSQVNMKLNRFGNLTVCTFTWVNLCKDAVIFVMGINGVAIVGLIQA